MPPKDESLLERWSRRKRESAVAAPAAPAQAPLPQLPPLDALTFESDFEAFMHAKVDERVRRMALKKLFSDARFNVMDGLDIYIDDYAKEDPIPPGMLAQLQHARSTLFGAAMEEGEKRPEAPPDAGTQPAESASNEPPIDPAGA